MIPITMKVGEAKHLVMTIKVNGQAYPLTNLDELTFAVKKKKTDETPIIEKETEDFDVTRATDGILSVFVDEEDTDIEANTYLCELKIVFLDGTIYKSKDNQFILEAAIT